ncbi:MAG: UDP-N-acetylmuramoyl-L-alanine--D-glutamate ligase [Sulfurospirillaceae bacterium]|nr:UDP-N-acetylmuramoyl-L-alanine--D-glutamate ligase [Sulfurospirillaceae bacterium]
MISLFGYGKTTKAIAQKIGNCQIFDDKFTDVLYDEFGNTLMPPSMFDSSKSTLQIPSPGFPTTHPIVKEANNLISEYDFFFDKTPLCVWISGTNGKTTTTQMCEHLLGLKGAVAGGNIGTPLADLSQKAPIWILETSSFTLHYTQRAYPQIYLLLPIKPDHISWHGSMEAYEEAKLDVLSRMREGSIAILPNKYAKCETLAYVIGYDNEVDLAQKLGVELEKVNFKNPFLLDATLALSVSKILFDKIDYEKINSFKTDAHKIEEFKDEKGRLWVDDSKGTNVDATVQALKRYSKEDILIILGGDDKGVPLDELFEEMKSLHVEIFAIGSNTSKLCDLGQQYGIKTNRCNTLEKAMEQIHKKHTLKTVALLSPAAASLDQFSSYAHRGNRFKELALS